MRVVFWGSPDFALPALRGLLESARHQVVAVVTQPDRPAGRGRKLQAPPVKRLAMEAGVKVLQPERPRGPDFLEELGALEPEISIVAAYGEILRPEVLETPARGSVNVHASLLPKLRGAAPVNWAIIRGFGETGVTIMRMVEKLDAGPIIHQVTCEIGPRTTAGELSERLAELGSAALLEALTMLESGRAREEPQEDSRATYAPKLSPADVRLDWSKPAVELDRWIRGSDPVPAAWSELGDLRVRLFSPEVVSDGTDAEPGRVLAAEEERGLLVGTGEGVLRLGEVQPAGKRRMRAVEWIRGRGVEAGRRFA